MKKSKNKVSLLVFVLAFIYWGMFGKAQQLRQLSLNQAIEEALKNNKELKAIQNEQEYFKELKKAAFDPGKTNLIWTGGQYNSINFDNSFTITQNIDFPGNYKRQAELMIAQSKTAEMFLLQSQNELVFKIKSAYDLLLFLKDQQKIFLKLDSLYNRLMRVAEIRFRTGESSDLEKLSIENEAELAKNLLIENQAEIKQTQVLLKILLHSNEWIDAVEQTYEAKNVQQTSDLSFLQNHPRLRWMKQKLDVSQKQISTEKARLYPGLTLGYFNQSLIGTQLIDGNERFFDGGKRFQGFQLGISLPLWSKPFAARIQAGEKMKLMAQNELSGNQKDLEGKYEQTLTLLESKLNLMESFRNKLLPQSARIILLAEKAYEKGEIAYIELFQNLNRAVDIEKEYIRQIYLYNQEIIHLEFLTGNQL